MATNTVIMGASYRPMPEMDQQTPWTDDAFLRAVAGGGAQREKALQWWFGDASLQHWVRRYAQQHGGDEADGEDLYHDTFITFDRLLRQGKFRGEASLKTYFCSIAKWQWVNRQRVMHRTVALNEQDKAEISAFVETDMFRRERQEMMEKMIESLGERCKRLLTMYQLSYSMKEIADAMGYATDQVAMNQCSECRKKLKHLIENNLAFKDFIHI